MRSWFVVLLLVPWFALSCASRSSVASDSWVRNAPGELISTARRVSNEDVHVVAQDQLASAEGRLQEMSFVALSAEEAERLAEADLTGEGFFLVRGICLGCGTGRFNVYFDGRRVAVDHVSLARATAEPTRWPIIVKLHAVPTEVYVQYHFAR